MLYVQTKPVPVTEATERITRPHSPVIINVSIQRTDVPSTGMIDSGCSVYRNVYNHWRMRPGNAFGRVGNTHNYWLPTVFSLVRGTTHTHQLWMNWWRTEYQCLYREPSASLLTSNYNASAVLLRQQKMRTARRSLMRPEARSQCRSRIAMERCGRTSNYHTPSARLRWTLNVVDQGMVS